MAQARPKRTVHSIYGSDNHVGRRYLALLEAQDAEQLIMKKPRREIIFTEEPSDDDDDDENSDADTEASTELDENDTDEVDADEDDIDVVDADEKWEYVKKTCKAIWPTITQTKGRKLISYETYTDLLSLEAMRDHARWYKTLRLDADAIDIVRVRANVLSNMMVKKGFTMTMTTLAIWKKYCDERYDGKYGVNSAMKVRNFIPYRVAEVLQNREDFLEHGHERRNLPEETAHEAARKVQSQIGKLAEIQGYMHSSQLQKETEIQSMLATYKNAMEEARLRPRDFAGSSKLVTKRLTKDERTRALEVVLNGDIRGRREQNVDLFHMRTYAIKYLEHNIIRRGQDLRCIHMGALMIHVIEDVGPAKCTALCASIRHVKENTTNTEFVLSWIPHADPKQCSMIAIANYMVWAIDIYQLEILHDMRRDLEAQPAWLQSGRRKDSWQSEWWSYRLLFGTDPKQELTYDIHLNGENKVHDAAKFEKKSGKTSLARTNNAHIALERGMNTNDLSHYGGWATTDGSAIGFYIDTAVKVEASMTMNGWDNCKKYTCARHSPDIPDKLCRKVFSGLDELYELAKATHQTTRLDLSAVKFCEVLLCLRRIFLEGAVDLRAAYPKLPVYSHQVFDSRDWRDWSRLEPGKRQIREGTFKLQDQDPALVAAVENMQKNVQAMIEAAAAQTGGGRVQGTPVQEDPADRTKVPVIPVFTSVTATYRFWDTTLRPFIIRHYNSVAWQGKTAEAKRVEKFKPFCVYIDYAILDKSEATLVIEKLEDIRKEKEASYAAYMHSFRVAIQGIKIHEKNKPSHTPEELGAALKAHGLPVLPNGMNVKAICKDLLHWK